jgi:hypothetical protein
MRGVIRRSGEAFATHGSDYGSTVCMSITLYADHNERL